MKKIITECNKYEDIPYLFFSEEGAKGQPMVIIAHGFNNDKFEGVKYALRLANEGIGALCFDLAKQGERYDGFMESMECDADFGNVLFTIIKESCEDVNKLINYLKQDARVDNSRIGISGFSHGANLCYYVLSQNEEIKAAVPILGAPDFLELIIYSMEKDKEDDFMNQKEQELLKFVKELNPISYLLEKEKRGMLLINAQKDKDVPPDITMKFYEKVIDRYEELPSDFELFLPDGSHSISDEMIEKAISWLRINL